MSPDDGKEVSPELEQMAHSLIESGLLNAGKSEVEADLGQRLQQELLRASQRGEQLPEWAQVSYGPADAAKRFLEFQRSAIYAELCDPKRKRLKVKYQRLLAPTTAKAATIAGLAATLLAVFGVSAPQVAVPSIAIYVALWLLHTDLEHICRQEDK